MAIPDITSSVSSSAASNTQQGNGVTPFSAGELRSLYAGTLTVHQRHGTHAHALGLIGAIDAAQMLQKRMRSPEVDNLPQLSRLEYTGYLRRQQLNVTNRLETLVLEGLGIDPAKADDAQKANAQEKAQKIYEFAAKHPELSSDAIYKTITNSGLINAADWNAELSTEQEKRAETLRSMIRGKGTLWGAIFGDNPMHVEKVDVDPKDASSTITGVPKKLSPEELKMSKFERVQKYVEGGTAHKFLKQARADGLLSNMSNDELRQYSVLLASVSENAINHHVSGNSIVGIGHSAIYGVANGIKGAREQLAATASGDPALKAQAAVNAENRRNGTARHKIVNAQASVAWDMQVGNSTPTKELAAKLKADNPALFAEFTKLSSAWTGARVRGANSIGYVADYHENTMYGIFKGTTANFASTSWVSNNASEAKAKHGRDETHSDIKQEMADYKERHQTTKADLDQYARNRALINKRLVTRGQSDDGFYSDKTNKEVAKLGELVPAGTGIAFRNRVSEARPIG